MKTNLFKICIIFLSICINSALLAQIENVDVHNINVILETSMYKSKLEIDKVGMVLRKDNNGNTFKYSLKDIESINYDFDGFHNLLLELKPGKYSVNLVNGKEGTSQLNVFSFESKESCDKAMKAFEKLIDKVNLKNKL